jgi:hypothetical protein
MNVTAGTKKHATMHDKRFFTQNLHIYTIASTNTHYELNVFSAHPTKFISQKRLQKMTDWLETYKGTFAVTWSPD